MINDEIINILLKLKCLQLFLDTTQSVLELILSDILELRPSDNKALLRVRLRDDVEMNMRNFL